MRGGNNKKEIAWKENWTPAKKANLDTPCWNCTSHVSSDDGYCTIYRNEVKRRIHHVMFEKEFGPIPKGKITRHKCDNTSCINPNHIILGTHKDNANDRKIRGRNNSVRGEQHGRSFFSRKLVVEIFESHLSCRALAKEYGVSVGAIQAIKNGKTWRHITQK